MYYSNMICLHVVYSGYLYYAIRSMSTFFYKYSKGKVISIINMDIMDTCKKESNYLLRCKWMLFKKSINLEADLSRALEDFKPLIY